MRSTFALALLAFASAAASAQLQGVAVANIDRAAAPCADFDAFANGQWRVDHPMPAIQTTWAVRSITQDDTRARLRTIAEEDAAKAASAPKGSPAQLTGDFYAACMDQPRIDALGLKPIEPLLKRLDAIRDPASLNAELIHLQSLALPTPMRLSASQDLHDTTRMIAEVSIGGLGLPDRDYYLRDEPRFKEAREK